MKRTFVLVVLLVMITMMFAESVILVDGRTLQGEIVAKKGDTIFLQSDGSIYQLTRNMVKQIKNDGNLGITKLTYKKKDFVREGFDLTNLTPLPIKEEYDYTQVQYNENLFMQPKNVTKFNEQKLILGATFAVLAWDYFATSGDYSDLIKDAEDFDAPKKEIDKLKKQKLRKIINGSLLSAASFYFFITSKEIVEIKMSPVSLEIGYKF